MATPAPAAPTRADLITHLAQLDRKDLPVAKKPNAFLAGLRTVVSLPTLVIQKVCGEKNPNLARAIKITIIAVAAFVAVAALVAGGVALASLAFPAVAALVAPAAAIGAAALGAIGVTATPILAAQIAAVVAAVAAVGVLAFLANPRMTVLKNERDSAVSELERAIKACRKAEEAYDNLKTPTEEQRKAAFERINKAKEAHGKAVIKAQAAVVAYEEAVNAKKAKAAEAETKRAEKTKREDCGDCDGSLASAAR